MNRIESDTYVDDGGLLGVGELADGTRWLIGTRRCAYQHLPHALSHYLVAKIYKGRQGHFRINTSTTTAKETYR